MNRRTIIIFFLLLSVFTAWMLNMNETMNADLVLFNGIIHTLDREYTVAEAVAVRDGKIIAVGSNHDVLASYKAPEMIDLDNFTVIPGLIDSHAHMLSLGLSKMRLDLTRTSSAGEIADSIRLAAQKRRDDEWILGRGWDQNNWDVREFPDHGILDDAAPGNPVYLVRVDGHAAWVNKRAMDMAGINRETGDPEGGRIIRDSNGNPTGVLLDYAMNLVSALIPEPSVSEKRQALIMAINECLAYGITTVHDMGMNLEVIDIYRDIIRRKEADFRLYVAIDGTGVTWDHFIREGRVTGHSQNMITIRSVKLFADGALGSRGAALLEPYSDDPGNRGLLISNEDEIFDVAVKALENGFQVCTHAIGDRANRIVLSAYERALAMHPVKDHRFRIEHAQIVHRDDLSRFSGSGIIPGMQPIHCTSDMSWTEDRVGSERISGAYAWRSFLNEGSIIAGGSDFPVEPVNPMLGIFAAETRQDEYLQPVNGWYAEERLSRLEAIRMFTSWAAYAAFEEDIKGSLEPGKLADFVIYEENIMAVSPRELLSVRPEKTYLGGKLVYQQTDE